MIRHHPDHNLLLEYASGSAPWAVSLAVSTHIQMCPQCRSTVNQMNQIGGGLLEDCAPQATDEDALNKLMTRIDEAPSTNVLEPSETLPAKADPCRRDPMMASLPRVVRKVVAGNGPLKWRRASPALKSARLKTGQDQFEVAFQKIGAGGKVAEHDHRGCEVTVVLYGSFSDSEGVYARGDFLMREPGDVHRPIATQDQDCLCLSVVEAPVAITGFLGKLINPLLSFRPA